MLISSLAGATQFRYGEEEMEEDPDVRVGHWSRDEEAYANKIAELFRTGGLPGCPEGTTMRSLLANLLNCSPMRVSKKYSGDNAVGKRAYRHADSAINESKEELKRLEENFHRSLGGASRKLNMSLLGTSGLKTPREVQKEGGPLKNKRKRPQGVRGGLHDSQFSALARRHFCGHLADSPLDRAHYEAPYYAFNVMPRMGMPSYSYDPAMWNHLAMYQQQQQQQPPQEAMHDCYQQPQPPRPALDRPDFFADHAALSHPTLEAPSPNDVMNKRHRHKAETRPRMAGATVAGKTREAGETISEAIASGKEGEAVRQTPGAALAPRLPFDSGHAASYTHQSVSHPAPFNHLAAYPQLTQPGDPAFGMGPGYAAAMSYAYMRHYGNPEAHHSMLFGSSQQPCPWDYSYDRHVPYAPRTADTADNGMDRTAPPQMMAEAAMASSTSASPPRVLPPSDLSAAAAAAGADPKIRTNGASHARSHIAEHSAETAAAADALLSAHKGLPLCQSPNHRPRSLSKDSTARHQPDADAMLRTAAVELEDHNGDVDTN